MKTEELTHTGGPNPTCPRCGAPVPAEAPQGLCPKCVLAGAAVPTETGSGSTATSEIPSLERVAEAFPQLEILELVGRGGMGFVFKARQPHLDRLVALKLLPAKLARDPRFTERFNREGRVLARLNHPNIVSIYDFGQAGGFCYLLMEFVDGVNLRQAMRTGRFSPAEALSIVPKVCEALQYAHDQGVLHRDIKPENILLDTKGRVKIADFGIAKLVGEQRPEITLTATGAALGTPHYMAPEQLEKPSEVDHRADIYSLGVVFYEMLTGELPIGRFAPPSAKTPVDHRVDVTPDPLAVGTDTSPGLEVADPAGRPPDAWFDREWALAVMDRALAALAAEFHAAEKALQFETLKPWLVGEASSLSQADAATRLGLSEGAVKVAVHRLRRRFRDLVKAEIAQTLPRSDDIDDELRHLIAALA